MIERKIEKNCITLYLDFILKVWDAQREDFVFTQGLICSSAYHFHMHIPIM